MEEKGLFPIGRVVKSHGVKGKMKVDYFGEDLSQFSFYREVLIEDKTGRLQAYDILEATPQPPRILMRLKGIDRVEDVIPLLGKEVLVRKVALPQLEEGEYYWFEILGMGVETEEGRRIGVVKEIIPTAGHDVYVVKGKRREIYLPATEEVVHTIDPEKGVITVVRKKGLWEKEDEV